MAEFTQDRSGLSLFRILIALIGFSIILAMANALAEEPRVLELAMKGREIDVPEATLRVDQGEEVVFRISSDEAAELHLHGYDVTIPLRAGEASDVRFHADVAGRFPITLHEPAASGGHSHDHKTLLYLEVHPD